jgi:hypothetical protein
MDQSTMDNDFLIKKKNKNSLTPPLFIAVPVAARKDNSHIFMC